MKTMELMEKKTTVPEVKIDWEQIQEEAEKKQETVQVSESSEKQDPYWKDYQEFLVNLA